MMSLRTIAEKDLGFILEGDSMGFRWPITVIDPVGVSAPLQGFSNDISQVIDPDTGQVVTGRAASVSLRISSIFGAGFTSLPVGKADSAIKPWLVSFESINGEQITFKVSESNPDRSIGDIILLLELYDL